MTEPSAIFSTCFGAPFMPRHPSIYGNLLKSGIATGGVDCWLVNTGWSNKAKYDTTAAKLVDKFVANFA